MLLAKQVWCMMNNKESLCYKAFKAKFFPDCSILEAKDSDLGSYAWKSNLSARDIIKRGTVWHIGDGQSVCIKEDKWLLDKVHRKVISLIPSIPPNAKVSCLIDANIGGWKADRINQLFLPHEASLVLSIPLSIKIPADRLI